jgi:hypothetical protein
MRCPRRWRACCGLSLDQVTRAVTRVQLRPELLMPELTIIPAHTNFASFSPTYLAVFMVAVSAEPFLNYLAGRPRGTETSVPAWDGDIVEFKSRMQYTAATFSNPTRVTF